MLIARDEVKRRRARAQWQTSHIFAHLLSKLCNGLFVPCSVTITVRFVEIKNPVHPAQFKSSVMAQTDASRVRGRIRWNHRFQAWRVRQSECMLCSARIGRSYGPNGAIGPGLGANPLGSVVAVVNIVAEKLPGTFRIESTAYVLEYDNISLLDPVVCIIDIVIFSVWRAL